MSRFPHYSWLILYSCFLLGYTGCQSPSAEEGCLAPEADQALVLADSAATDAEALQHYEQAAALYREANCPKGWVTAGRRAASVAGREADSLAIGRLQAAISNCWWPDDAETGKLHLSLGFFLDRSGRFYEAGEAYEKARILHEQAGDPVAPQSGKFLYKPLANIHTRLGDHELARNLLRQAIDSASVQQDTFTQAEAYGDLAKACWDIGQFEEALGWIDSGLVALEAVVDLAPEKRSDARGLLLATRAQILLGQGKPEEALPFALEAVDIIRDSCRFLYKAGAHSILGEVEEQLGYTDLSQKAYQTAYDLYTYCLEDPNRRELAKLELAMGRLAAQEKRYADALQLAHSALVRVAPGIDPQDPSALPDPEDLYPENTILEALSARGEWIWQSGADEPQEAIAALELAAQVADRLRDHYAYASSKLYLAAQSRRIQEKLMNLYWERWARDGDSLAIAAAFRVMEKSRAVLLKQKFAARQLLPDDAPARQIQQRELLLQRQLADLRDQRYQLLLSGAGGDQRQLRSLDARIFRLESARQRLLDSLDQRYPEYYRLRYDDRVSDLAELRKYLPQERSMLVEYFQQPHNGEWFIIGIDQEDASFRRTFLDPGEVSAYLNLFNNLANAEERSVDTALFRQFYRRGKQLYDTLLAPVLSGKMLNHLIIIPDGPLAALPFDLLLPRLPAAPEVDYRNLPYLLKEMRIHFGNSATLLTQAPRSRTDSYAGNYLGISPDYSHSSLGEVRYGKETVEKLGRLLGGKTLIGEQATIDCFLRLGDRYRIIHYYGHAGVQDQLPLFSWLAFSYRPEQQAKAVALLSAKTDDKLLGEAVPNVSLEERKASWLYAHHLYALPLGAELVFLSACETGLGPEAGGEGALSLARAFQYAGAPNTIMTTWKVQDESTARLSELFFRYLAAGETQAAALQKAKLAYLNDPVNKAFPFYWAGLSLVGEDRRLLMTAPQRGIIGFFEKIWLVALAVVVLAAGLFAAIWQSKKRLI